MAGSSWNMERQHSSCCSCHISPAFKRLRQYSRAHVPVSACQSDVMSTEDMFKCKTGARAGDRTCAGAFSEKYCSLAFIMEKNTRSMFLGEPLARLLCPSCIIGSSTPGWCGLCGAVRHLVHSRARLLPRISPKLCCPPAADSCRYEM